MTTSDCTVFPPAVCWIVRIFLVGVAASWTCTICSDIQSSRPFPQHCPEPAELGAHFTQSCSEFFGLIECKPHGMNRVPSTEFYLHYGLVLFDFCVFQVV